MPTTVLIPSKGRREKLLRCINSIPLCFDIAIHATCPEDVPEVGRPISVSFGDETIVQSFNLLASRVSGDVLPACDDVEFMPGCIEAAVAKLESLSPRHVIGLKVVNGRCNDDAFMLVGRELIAERGHLFYPKFEHFYADTELGRYAKNRGLFVVCPEAQMINYHPMFSGEYDATHRDRRMDKWNRDKAIWDRIKGTPPGHSVSTSQM